jgi:hypothetical protein
MHRWARRTSPTSRRAPVPTPTDALHHNLHNGVLDLGTLQCQRPSPHGCDESAAVAVATGQWAVSYGPSAQRKNWNAAMLGLTNTKIAWTLGLPIEFRVAITPADRHPRVFRSSSEQPADRRPRSIWIELRRRGDRSPCRLSHEDQASCRAEPIDKTRSMATGEDRGE